MAPPRRSPRAVLISVLLVLALGLAGLLAFNAQATFREHRATAERVLRDYARLAAARFAQRTAQNLYYMACWPVVDPRAMAPFYTMSSEKFPLLPRPLTGGVIYDSLGSLEVTEPAGRELYHSPVRYHPMFTARDSVEPMMAGLHVQVTLRPDIA